MNKFDKNTIFNILKTKAKAKGFNIEPDKNKMAKGANNMASMLEVVAETIAEVMSKNSSGEISGSLKLGPPGLQQPAAYKNATVKADITTDPGFFGWIETFHALLQAVYPEPGNGSPNVFATTLKTLISQKPSSITAKISDGSSNIKITI